MNTKPIWEPNFMGKTAKIIAEVRNRTYIDDDDVEVIKEILQDELKEYYDEAYKDGYDDGYDGGYDDGYSEAF